MDAQSIVKATFSFLANVWLIAIIVFMSTMMLCLFLDCKDQLVRRFRGWKRRRSSKVVASWDIAQAEYQGCQRFREDGPDENIQTAFAEGPGSWTSLRFGDGKRTYRVAVLEVEDD